MGAGFVLSWGGVWLPEAGKGEEMRLVWSTEVCDGTGWSC